MLGSVGVGLEAGEVKVLASNGGAHPSSVWGGLMTRKIVSVSSQAPRPIQDQALAYQAKVRACATHYINEARKDTLAHLAAKLEAEGHVVAAAFIRAQEIV